MEPPQPSRSPDSLSSASRLGSDSGLSIEQLQQIDQACDRYELACHAERPPAVESFLEHIDSALRPHLQAELEAIRQAYPTGGGPADVTAPYTASRPLSAGDAAAKPATGTAGLHLRCPHCQNGLELLDDADLDQITCESCGSNFSLVGPERSLAGAPATKRVGRFDLVNRLGSGGFGTVWQAYDPELDRAVAIKIPRRGHLQAKEAELFFREARAAAQLRHPNIVSVHEVGRDGESIFIVSDLITGQPLSDCLDAYRAQPRKIAKLLATVCEALDFAHQHGIVHRDLKPSNLMLSTDNEPYLMDFGLAKRDVGEITMTVDGQVLGTPAYMSPEQAAGQMRWVDRRTDIYSLGVMVFQMLTGELPFRGSAQSQMLQRQQDDPPSPKKLAPKTPLDLATLCLKCLERDPNRRYSTAAEVGAELQRYLNGEPLQARPLSPLGRAARWSRRRPALASALGLTCLLAVTGPTAALIIQQQSEKLAERVEEIEGIIKQDEKKLASQAMTIASLEAERQQLLGVSGERPAADGWRRSAIESYLDQHQITLEEQISTARPPQQAQALLRLAALNREINRPAEARELLKTALPLLKRLDTLETDSIQKNRLHTLADTQLQLADLYLQAGQTDEAQQLLSQATDTAKQLRLSGPSTQALRQAIQSKQTQLSLESSTTIADSNQVGVLKATQEGQRELLQSLPSDIRELDQVLEALLPPPAH